MIVGVAVVEIHVHESQSLKAKRGVVRSIAGRLRSRFNLSVGEVGGQGTWQRATIGMSMTGSDEGVIRRSLLKAIEFVEGMHLAQVIDSDVEILRMPLANEPMLGGECDDDENDDGAGAGGNENERPEAQDAWAEEAWDSNLSESKDRPERA